MSVADRINECLKKYTENDFDNALIQAFIAIDGTAKKTLGIKENKKRFIGLIKANLDLMSKVIFLIDSIPENKFLNDKSLADLLYDMRCSILHEGFLEKIVWNKSKLKFSGEKYLVPESLIIALVFVVIAQKENSEENIDRSYFIKFCYKDAGIRFRYSEWLGDKNRIMNHFNHLLVS